MSNPFTQLITKPPAPSTPAPDNPFASLVQPTGQPETVTPAGPDMSTALGRQQADQQNTMDNLAKLRAITPGSPEQAEVLKRHIAALEATLPHGPLGAVIGEDGGLEGFVRGASAGAIKGIMAGADLAAKTVDLATGLIGKHPAQPLIDRIAEASQDVNEEINPTGGGGAGAIGDVAGNIVTSLPAYGSTAELTAAKIIQAAPESAVAKALISATKPGASYITRAIANMASGSVINSLQALETPGQDPSQARTPEEAAQIRNNNLQTKLKQFAIGIAGDALFAAIPHGKGDTGSEEVPVTSGQPPAPDTPLTPARQAQLDAAKQKASDQAAAAKSRKLQQQQAQIGWAQDNPGQLWSDLSKDDKKAAVAKYAPAAPDASVTAPYSSPDVAKMQEQIAALNKQLSDAEVDHRSAQRLAETDPLLDIGNVRAMNKVAPQIDADPNMVWISADANGMKDINDNLGHGAGDEFLKNNRDAVIQAVKESGVSNYHIFRPGGDELMVAVPKAKAEDIANQIENLSTRDYTSPDGSVTKRGTLSASVFDTTKEAESQDGQAQLASRKIMAKAVHGIPGRNAEEQGLIDAVRGQLDTGEAPAAGSVAGAPAAGSGTEPSVASSQPLGVESAEDQAMRAGQLPPEAVLPPEVEQMVSNIHKAGGLETGDQMDALIHEVNTIRAKNLPPDQYHAQLKDLEEDFTPYNPSSDIEKQILQEHEDLSGSPVEAEQWLKAQRDAGVSDEQSLADIKRQSAEYSTPHEPTELSQKFGLAVKKVMDLTGMDEMTARRKMTPLIVQEYLLGTSEDEIVRRLDVELADLDKMKHGDVQKVQDAINEVAKNQAPAQGSLAQQAARATEAAKQLGTPEGHLEAARAHEKLLNSPYGLSNDEIKNASKMSSYHREQVDNLVGLKAPDDGSGAPGTQPQDVPSTGAVRATSPASGASAASDTPPPVSTRLETVKGGKPLEELTAKQLDKLEDHLIGRLQKVQEGSVMHESLQADLDKVMAQSRKLAEPDYSVKIGDVDAKLQRSTAPIEEMGRGTPNEQQIHEAAEAVKPPGPAIMAERLQSMSTEKLQSHTRQLEALLKRMPSDDPMWQKYRKRLDGALTEAALRYKGGNGAVAQMPPGVGGAALGFAYGYMSSGDKDETDRITNALEWAGVGAVAGTLGARMLARADVAKPVKHADIPAGDLPGGGWQAEIRKSVRPADPRAAKPVPFLERLRTIYAGVVRRSYVMERWQESVGGSRLGVKDNAAKLIAMAGRWMGQAESAIRYGPAIHDEFGNVKRLDALGVGDILDLVKGDSDSLGELMAARTKIELGDSVKTPFDELTAQMVYSAMPENFHQAADEARKFSLAMADVMVDGGILSQAARDLFANESMYAALQRVFKFDTSSAVSAEKTTKALVKATNPVYMREGGSADLIKNPFDVMVQTVPFYYRAAELNKIKTAMVDAWEAAGSPTHLMSRIQKSEMAASPAHDMKIAELKKSIDGISDADAQALVSGLDPTSIDQQGRMRVYRNGELSTYRIPKYLAVAMQTLNPEELGQLTKILGVPARLASKGITLNPYFVGKMALYDAWQATLNSQYGFRFGVDNIRGFMAAARQSKAYQTALEAGLSHQTIYSSGRNTISGDIQAAKTSLGSPMEVAVRQLKQLKPIEAYKTLIGPFADAARVGEFLRAKDHGASDLEAVFAAKQVTANYSEIGTFTQMRALQHMTMFLGPAIQVMDQAVYRAGIHPFRTPEEGRLAAAGHYAAWAFMTIALPSMYLWHVNKDDDEINQLRQTQTGRKYWFIRSTIDAPGIKKGDIIKIPKPPIDGQVFGTSMENMLDQQNGMSPGGVAPVTTAILRDAAFNILPSAGVIPYSLQANQDLSTGRSIIPLSDDELALQYQGDQKASWLARTVSSEIAPSVQNSQSTMLRNAATPAGIDYLINSVAGMLGQDVAAGISQAVESQTKGYVPAKNEWPLVSKLFAQYPSMNVRSVQNFYDRANQVQSVAATIDHLVKTSPDQVLGFAQSNEKDIMLIKAYEEVRQNIANSRRTILDIQNAPSDMMTSQDKRQMIGQITQQIIDKTTQLEEFTQQVDAKK